MDSTFAADAAFPPSLDGAPILTMLTVMALWLGTLLCLQWIYAIVEDIREAPLPRWHPITAARAVRLVLLFAVLIQTVPRLVLVMSWQSLPPAIREAFALGSWLVYIPWAMALAVTWWLDRGLRPTARRVYVLMRCQDLPAVSWGVEKRRGLVIAGLILLVAFATTYIRPEAHAPARGHLVERN